MAITYDRSGDGHGNKGVIRVIYDWTSDSGGDAAATSEKVVGRLVKAITDPGSAAPTDDYDIVITDDESVNLLTACDDDLVDRDTTTTEEVYFLVKDHAGTPLAQSFSPIVCSPLTLTVSNAGDSKTGQLFLFIET